MTDIPDLGPEAYKFLAALENAGVPAKNSELPYGSSRAQDRARRWCQYHELAYHTMPADRIRTRNTPTFGWVITPTGRAALRNARQQEKGQKQ